MSNDPIPCGAEICHINLSRGFRGGERQTTLLIEELAARGWAQRAVVRGGGKLAERLRSVPHLKLVEKSANLLTASCFGGNSTLLHVHQGRSLYVAGLQRLFRRRPYIVTRRVDNPVRSNWLKRCLYRHAACVIALTEAIAGVVNQFDPSIRCTVIPDATSELPHDPAVSARIRALTGRTFLVGHVGALDDSQKGQRQLLEAARQLHLSAPDIGFMLVGEGRDGAALRAAAAGLDNVYFAGQVSNVGDYLAAFDLFAFPSRREGFGSIILDAYQHGLPVIAARTGGIPEIVRDGSNGTLFEVDDICSLTATLVRYRDDRQLRERVGATNAQTARHYGPETMTDRYEKIYRQILATTPAHA